MRYLALLCCSFFFVACLSDVALEDEPLNDPYPITPPAATRDTAAAVTPEAAPTPYGMVIDQDQPDRQAKGSADTESAAPALAARKLLTGRWVNTTDGEEVVAFTPTHYQTYYEGELLVEEDMTFHGQCPAACSGGSSTEAPCFTISGPAQTDCYGIVRLTDDLLELQVLGVSTETVVYRRAD